MDAARKGGILCVFITKLLNGRFTDMRKVQFTETVMRDANQSLMATRLPYSDFEEILPTMDKAGYYSVECWGGATFDSCLRYLGEDPWARAPISRPSRATRPSCGTGT